MCVNLNIYSFCVVGVFVVVGGCWRDFVVLSWAVLEKASLGGVLPCVKNTGFMGVCDGLKDLGRIFAVAGVWVCVCVAKKLQIGHEASVFGGFAYIANRHWWRIWCIPACGCFFHFFFCL